MEPTRSNKSPMPRHDGGRERNASLGTRLKLLTILPAVVIGAISVIALFGLSAPVSAWLPVAALAFAIAQIVLATQLHRRLLATTQTVVALSKNVAAGDLQTPIEIGRNDEIGSMLQALASMQKRLIEEISDGRRLLNESISTHTETEKTLAQEASNLRQSADEGMRVRSALDVTSTNVMIADAEGYIRYTNASVRQMLTAAEADLRKALPKFSVETLVGTHFDGFHKNPAHQRNLLAKLTSTYRTQIVVGARTFQLIATPIQNAAGQRTGTVVEWLDRTAEVAVEKEISEIISGATRGDFSTRLRLDDKQGFFKQLAEGINHLLEVNSASLNEVVRMLSALAQGDLTESITAQYEGLFGQLKDDSNLTVAQLNKIVSEIRQATEAISNAASEIASGNNDLSARTEAQASSLQETASTMHELTATVKQNAANAAEANQLASDASGVAIKGGTVVNKVVETMGSISQSSKKIVDIISVIDGIAFQTNILALNAAVEAARAGEQGRGFAVVASEVRSLSQRSAGAAREIKDLITDSVRKVEAGSQLVASAGQTMTEILQSIQGVANIMAQITAASSEQSSGIEQVNQAIAQIEQATQQNAALVEEASAAAKSMEDQSQLLQNSVSVFRLTNDAGGFGSSSEWDGTTERRSANRSKNVARLVPGSRRGGPSTFISNGADGSDGFDLH